jgi:hypothetical protein
MNAPTAKQAYDHRQRLIRAHVAQLLTLLDEHQKKAAADELDWGYVGDLGRVIELLNETISALGGQVTTQSPVVKPGDRVRLIHMPSDPAPIKPGTTGTVVAVTGGAFPQIQVEWDSGRSLALLLLPGVDDFEVLD